MAAGIGPLLHCTNECCFEAAFTESAADWLKSVWGCVSGAAHPGANPLKAGDKPSFFVAPQASSAVSYALLAFAQV